MVYQATGWHKNNTRANRNEILTQLSRSFLSILYFHKFVILLHYFYVFYRTSSGIYKIRISALDNDI